MAVVDRQEWRAILDGALVPVTPLPRTAAGEVAAEGIQAYSDWMRNREVAGVVPNATVARPQGLSAEQQTGLLTHWREALKSSQAVIARVGGGPRCESPRGFRDETVKAARRALKAGANALWPKAPALCCGDEKEADLVVDYYDKLTRLGSPIIASLDDGNGHPLDWTVDTVSRLGQIEGVVAVQVGGSGALEQQQTLTEYLRTCFPELPILTAEPRFPSYALMLGATGAVFALGAVCTDSVAEMVRTHADNRYHRFHALYRPVEALSRALYAPPVEALTQRLLWTLELTGVLPAGTAYDPDAPELPDTAREELRETLERVGELRPEKRRKKTEDEELQDFLKKQQTETTPDEAETPATD